MKKVSLIIFNAKELLTLSGPKRARIGKEMGELGIIEDGAVAVDKGRIVDVGKTSQIKKKYQAEETIDAKVKVVIPGFVDSHTHLIYAGTREDELSMKLKGMSYMDILKAGGGILKTVRETRKASKKELFDLTKKRLDNMLINGTTTVEIKSGYGLTTKDEIKLLEVINELKEKHPVDIVPTFLGAHAIPPELDADGYVDLIINEMIPLVAKKKLAKFCDVFCEKGVFSVEQSRRILNEGKKYGLKPKIHADEIANTNGAELAAEVNAISAEHLLKSSEEGIRKLSKSKVIATLLPATSFCLNANYVNARIMIDNNVPVALATDFNPGCLCSSIQFVLNLACYKLKMTPEEAITASTINSAYAIDMGSEVGSLEIGKKADILIMDVPSYKLIPQYLGTNLVEKVIKNGTIKFSE
jgi:imidazolonepropionase